MKRAYGATTPSVRIRKEKFVQSKGRRLADPYAGSPLQSGSVRDDLPEEEYVYADYPSADEQEEEYEAMMEPIQSRRDGSTYESRKGYEVPHDTSNQDRESLKAMGVDVDEADRLRRREKDLYSPSVTDYLRTGRRQAVKTPPARVRDALEDSPMATVRAQAPSVRESFEGSPMRQNMAPFGYAARGMTPVDAGVPLGDSLPEVIPENLINAVNAKRATMGVRSGDGPAVGMAQRLKFKISKKVQGLVSEYNRLKSKPSPRELSFIVHPRNGPRQTLRDNRLEAVMREMANLKADVNSDGLGQFLANTELNRAHYLSSGVTPSAISWFVNNVTPALTHYERSGITQQYVGGSRQGYRYAK